LTLAPAAAVLAVGATVSALGLAIYPAGAVHGPLRTRLAVLGLGAVGLLLGGLVARTAAPLPWSIGLLGISAAAAMLAGGGSVERLAPLYGPGLLVAAELAYWAVGQARFPSEPLGVARRRALLLVTMAAAGAVLALLVTLAAGLAKAAAGLEVRVLGVGAMVMVAWIVAGPGAAGRRALRSSGPSWRCAILRAT
jgi:hypothetical protein